VLTRIARHNPSLPRHGWTSHVEQMTFDVDKLHWHMPHVMVRDTIDRRIRVPEVVPSFFSSVIANAVVAAAAAVCHSHDHPISSHTCRHAGGWDNPPLGDPGVMINATSRQNLVYS
jgi:hypothetical protein